jgi:hypothetical protein
MNDGLTFPAYAEVLLSAIFKPIMMWKSCHVFARFFNLSRAFAMQEHEKARAGEIEF